MRSYNRRRSEHNLPPSLVILNEVRRSEESRSPSPIGRDPSFRPTPLGMTKRKVSSLCTKTYA